MGPWQLELGGRAVARFAFAEFDFPWVYADISDVGEFDRFRPYFADVDDWPETPEFESLLHEINTSGGFALRDLTSGEVYRSLTLRQRGGTVWFRGGPEPPVASDGL